MRGLPNWHNHVHTGSHRAEQLPDACPTSTLSKDHLACSHGWIAADRGARDSYCGGWEKHITGSPAEAGQLAMGGLHAGAGWRIAARGSVPRSFTAACCVRHSTVECYAVQQTAYQSPALGSTQRLAVACLLPSTWCSVVSKLARWR
jgi:hypothetical protein